MSLPTPKLASSTASLVALSTIVWNAKATVGAVCGCGAVDCYTLQGRCVCVFGVKYDDLYGSEDAVAQGADWHSDAGME